MRGVLVHPCLWPSLGPGSSQADSDRPPFGAEDPGHRPLGTGDFHRPVHSRISPAAAEARSGRVGVGRRAETEARRDHPTIQQSVAAELVRFAGSLTPRATGEDVPDSPGKHGTSGDPSQTDRGIAPAASADSLGE